MEEEVKIPPEHTCVHCGFDLRREEDDGGCICDKDKSKVKWRGSSSGNAFLITEKEYHGGYVE